MATQSRGHRTQPDVLVVTKHWLECVKGDAMMRYLSQVIAGMLVVLIPATSAAQSYSDAEAAHKKGLKLFEAARYQEAIASYQESLRIYEKVAGANSLHAASMLGHLGTCYKALAQ
jgi:tetratricopeptide (TPR) repeat protein